MKLVSPTLILALGAASGLSAFAESAKNRGAALFVENGCQHCHTIRKVGGTKGPDLSGVGLTLNKTQIHKQISEGGHQMPSFANILKTSEVDDLVAFLHSCRDKRPKEQ
ncbi:c-type cytochrome [Tunturiibacter gelidiferens]|uniref:c-type cytochrome n=1 Tax=Tunturiibacter gelidiferens TaxID=3069689 RepID=UPI003D9BE732